MLKTKQEKENWFAEKKYISFQELLAVWTHETGDKDETVISILITAFKHFNRLSVVSCGHNIDSYLECEQSGPYMVEADKMSVRCYEFNHVLHTLKIMEYLANDITAKKFTAKYLEHYREITGFKGIHKTPSHFKLPTRDSDGNIIYIDYHEIDYDSYGINKWNKVTNDLLVELKKIHDKNIYCGMPFDFYNHNGLIETKGINNLSTKDYSDIKKVVELFKKDMINIPIREIVNGSDDYYVDGIPDFYSDEEAYRVQSLFTAEQTDTECEDFNIFIFGSSHYMVKLSSLVQVLDLANDVYNINYPALFKGDFSEQPPVTINRDLHPLVDVCQKVYEHLWVNKNVDNYTKLKKSKQERLKQIRKWADENKIESEWRNGETYFLSHRELKSVVEAIEAVTTPAKFKKSTTERPIKPAK